MGSQCITMAQLPWCFYTCASRLPLLLRASKAHAPCFLPLVPLLGPLGTSTPAGAAASTLARRCLSPSPPNICTLPPRDTPHGET